MENKYVHIHILRSSGRFEPYFKILERTIQRAVEKTADYISLHPIDIVVYDDSRQVIPGFGHGGRTNNPHTMCVFLDPAFPDFEHTIKKEIPKTISHELHHAVRWKAVGYGMTLLERLVSEGLAICFEQDVWGGTLSPWATALSGKSLADIHEKAKSEYTSTTFHHGRWFYGTGDLPRWAGYSLGYQLVGEYLREHADKNAAMLVSTPLQSMIASGLR
ncbi:MAG: DUF2268 domain-containing putative Zn-dependent protease [Patescibacteria group bacterium]